MRTRRDNRPPFIGGGGPNLNFQFALDKSLTPRIGPTLDFTRGSSGTFRDSFGVLQTAVNGAARFDHSPVSPFTSLGLFIEEARAKRSLWNRDFTNGVWAKTNIDFLRPVYLEKYKTKFYLNKISQYKVNGLCQLELIRI